MSFSRTRAIALGLSVAFGATLLPVKEVQAQQVVYGTPGAQRSGIGLGGAGLLLLLGGLVASGAGFAVLYSCREGESCHNDTTTTVGWVLAAPGIPPIALGALFLWLDKGGPSSRTIYNQPALPVTFTAGPIPSGGMFGATYNF